jgi:hypothetical protein
MYDRIGMLVLVLAALISCQKQQTPPKRVNESPTGQTEEIEKEEVDTFPYPGRPIWGYRYSLEGDFDGNGVQDTLIERFIDANTQEETNKFFSDLPLMDHQLYDYKERQVEAFLEDKHQKIGRLNELGQMGVYYGEVIGDVDENGTDELGIVGFDAYPSSLCNYSIFSYDVKKKEWKILFHFRVREWEFPQLPAYNKVYGPFGSFEEKEITDQQRNGQLEDEQKAFERVRKVSPKCIEFKSMLPVMKGKYDFDATYILHEPIDSISAWVVETGARNEPHIEYHRIFYPFFMGIYEGWEKDTFEVDPFSNHLQQVKFK